MWWEKQAWTQKQCFQTRLRQGRHEQFVCTGTDNINKVWCACGAVFDKCEAAINMRRQSSGALRPLPLQVFFFFFFLYILSLFWCINMAWFKMLKSTQISLGWCSFPGCCIGHLFIYFYLDLMLVLLLDAVVHFLWHSHTPSITTPSPLWKQHCLNHCFTYLIKETHALKKREYSW